ncbi:MAG: VWA domain-containing protein [Planctomycetota bacterium]
MRNRATQLRTLALLIGAIVGLGLDGGIRVASSDELQLNAQQRRLKRILQGRSDRVRLETLQRLQTAPDQSPATLKVLVESGHAMLASIKVDDDVPESITVWWRLIGDAQTEIAGEFLSRAAGHENERCSQIAIDVMGHRGDEQGVDAIADQVSRAVFRTDYGYRFSLVRALARIGGPRATELLRELETKLGGQLAHEIRVQLSDVDVPARRPDGPSGRDKLVIPDEAVQLDETTISSESDAVSEPLTPMKLVDVVDAQSASSTHRRQRLIPSSQYYGIDLNAKRLLFVIDRSGSMNQASGFSTRLESAKTELIRAIIGLAEDAEFSILVFDTTVIPWRSELQWASDENKREATMFIEQLRAGSRTNTHGACLEAMDFDPQLEVVFLLTDGQPTEGKRKMPGAIIADVAQRNRYRHLRFNTIGVGVSGHTKEFLRLLAESTSGEFRDVE